MALTEIMALQRVVASLFMLVHVHLEPGQSARGSAPQISQHAMVETTAAVVDAVTSSGGGSFGLEATIPPPQLSLIYGSSHLRVVQHTCPMVAPPPCSTPPAVVRDIDGCITQYTCQDYGRNKPSRMLTSGCINVGTSICRAYYCPRNPPEHRYYCGWGAGLIGGMRWSSSPCNPRACT